MRADPPHVNVVIDQGVNAQPLDSNIEPSGNRIRVSPAGRTALTAPSVADGGAAEFDVAVSGSSPNWDVTVTWLGAGLAALPLGVTNRTITVTSTGATNSPVSIPVRITAV